jgi:MFS family permease
MVKDQFLRTLFALLVVANFAFGGTVLVGVPYLADTRFPGGAVAFGVIMSGYAGGNLLGILLSGALPKMTGRRIKVLMVVMFLMFSVGIGAMAWIDITWLATLDLFILGVLNGYLGILLITGLQRNTPKEMMGRLMSMILLASMGLMPLSQAISGAILKWNVTMLFLGAGVLLFICTLYLLNPAISNLLSVQLEEQTSANA